VSFAGVDFYAMNSDGSKGDHLSYTFAESDGSFMTIYKTTSEPILAEASGGFH
jgi:hypothetical protein